MRIAQVAPLYESVPPKAYGGTERIVSYLTEELVAQGHDVTLFASGDSVTRARLVPACPNSLRLDPACIDQLAHHVAMLERVAQDAPRFDVIHYHVDYLHFPISRRLRTPHVTTLHGRLDIPDLQPLYHEFRDMPVISISDAQREPLPYINWQRTIHHGLPVQLYTFRPEPDDYLAFIGRISPEKRVDRAVEIARRAGMKLKVAAKVDAVDKEYFDREIAHKFESEDVAFLGEIGEVEKNEFLGRARALLFPIDWPEPFGMVMIESMACGTPVIAYANGSVPEVLEDGVSGFIVHGVEEAVAAVGRVPMLSRRRCREAFEHRFTAGRMAQNYVATYEHLAAGTRAA